MIHWVTEEISIAKHSRICLLDTNQMDKYINICCIPIIPKPDTSDSNFHNTSIYRKWDIMHEKCMYSKDPRNTKKKQSARSLNDMVDVRKLRSFRQTCLQFYNNNCLVGEMRVFTLVRLCQISAECSFPLRASSQLTKNLEWQNRFFRNVYHFLTEMRW